MRLREGTPCTRAMEGEWISVIIELLDGNDNEGTAYDSGQSGGKHGVSVTRIISGLYAGFPRTPRHTSRKDNEIAPRARRARRAVDSKRGPNIRSKTDWNLAKPVHNVVDANRDREGIDGQFESPLSS